MDYVRVRNERVADNIRRLQELGIHDTVKNMRSLCDHSASTKRSKSGKKNTSSEDSESDYLLEEENQGEHDDDDESLEEEQPRPLMIEVLLLSWCRGLRFFSLLCCKIVN